MISLFSDVLLGGLDIQSLFFFLHLYKPRLTWVSQNNCVDTCILDKEPSLLN